MSNGMSSILPENIFLLIIALLYFHDAAARTRLLSESWQNIWYSTKNIQFHESFFVRPNDDEAEQEVQRRNFIDFVIQWISRYNGGPIINNFSFILKNPQNYMEDIKLIYNFIHRNKVKFLEFDFSNPNWDDADLQNQSGCISFEHAGDNVLEHLKLYACKILDFEYFHALKTLCLGWVEATTESVRDILSKCPVLETLELEKCWNLNYLEIRVPSLKALVVNKCGPLSEGVKVSAINLESFKYIGTTVRKLELDSSLMEAYFDFGTILQIEEEIRNVLVDLLIDHVINVNNLTICSNILQIVPSYETELLEFSFLNAEQLTLKTKLGHQELFGVYFFLIMCPYLEVLCIDLSYPEYRLFEEVTLLDQEFADEEVPECITRTLTTLKVNWFSGESNEILVLEYILRNGAALKNVFIEVAKENDQSEERFDRANQFMQFPRASENAQFFIY